MSFENPPSARPWKLDIVKNTVAAIGANPYKTDSGAWGHADPVSGKPVKRSSAWHPPPAYPVWCGDALVIRVRVGARQASMSECMDA